MKHAVRLGVDSIDEQWAPFWKKSHVNIQVTLIITIIHVDNLRVCSACIAYDAPRYHLNAHLRRLQQARETKLA
jgi:hypothetical protein